MPDLQTLRANIADTLPNVPNIIHIDRAINTAIKYYSSYPFRWNETSGTFSTVASQQTYTTSDGMPSDIVDILHATITVNSSILTLKKVSFQELRELAVTTSYTGYPQCYAWYANTIYLEPIPDNTYTVTLYYRKSYTDLSSGTDSNDFTSNAPDLIEARARWWIYSRYINDPAMAMQAKAEEMEELKSISCRNTSLLSTGRIRPTTF